MSRLPSAVPVGLWKEATSGERDEGRSSEPRRESMAEMISSMRLRWDGER